MEAQAPEGAPPWATVARAGWGSYSPDLLAVTEPKRLHVNASFERQPVETTGPRWRELM